MADDARLTPLGAMVLALLAEGDMHPYEMLRLLRHRRDDRIIKLTNGTFYHTVARLERRGLIAEVGVDRDGNRPERTTYALLPESHAVLEDWVRTGLGHADRQAEFRVALAEAHNLPRVEVIELLGARRAALEAERADLRAKLDAARAGGVREQFLIELDRHAALLDAELGWTSGFLHRLVDPGFDWVGDKHSRTSGGIAPGGTAPGETARTHRAGDTAQRKASRR